MAPADSGTVRPAAVVGIKARSVCLWSVSAERRDLFVYACHTRLGIVRHSAVCLVVCLIVSLFDFLFVLR